MRVMRGERPSRPLPADGSMLQPTDDAWALISRCWAHESYARPKMAEVCGLLAGANAVPTSAGSSQLVSEPTTDEPVQRGTARVSVDLDTSPAVPAPTPAVHDVTAAQLAAANPAESATQHRPRRTRRTPSQLSTCSLPEYNKEAGAQELVIKQSASCLLR
jgi:hypothetical protein